MAEKRLFTNNAVSLLATAIDANATSLTVLPGHGSMYPTPAAANEFFVVTLEDQTAQTREIVHVTQRNGDTFTILRGQEGTTPLAWSATTGTDTLVDHRITADTLYYLKDVFVDPPDPPATDLSYANPNFPALVTYKEALDYLLSLQPDVDNPTDLTGVLAAIANINSSIATLTTGLANNNSYANAAFPNLTNFTQAIDYLIDPTFYTDLQAAIVEIQNRLKALEDNSKVYTNENFPQLTTYDLALDYVLQGSPVSGGQMVDANVSTTVVGEFTNVDLPSAYKVNTTAVYIGGVRQKRGIDFLETTSTQLQLQFVLTPQMIADGQNVVVDYVLA